MSSLEHRQNTARLCDSTKQVLLTGRELQYACYKGQSERNSAKAVKSVLVIYLVGVGDSPDNQYQNGDTEIIKNPRSIELTKISQDGIERESIQQLPCS